MTTCPVCRTAASPVPTGLAAHPCCDPGPPLGALEDQIAAWLPAALAADGPPPPGPWTALAEQAERDAAILAGKLAALRELAARPVPTGASVAATIGRDGPPPRRPQRWPAGSNGEAANRIRRYEP